MSLSRSFVIYTASSIAASALPLALLPVMTRYLSASEYGIVATMTTLIAFLTPPVAWGLPAITAIEHSKRAEPDFKRFIASTLRIPLVSLLLLTALAVATSPWLAPQLEIPPLWFMAVPLLAGFGVLPQVLSAILRMRNAAMTFGALEIGTAASTVALSVVFVVGLEWHWQGRVLAYGATSAIVTLVAAIWLWRHGFLQRIVDPAALRDTFRFGLGLLPHDIGNQAIRLSDRLFLVALIGLSGAGQYAVAAQVTGVVMVLLSAFNRAWAPYLFPRLANSSPETRRNIVRQSYGVMLGFLGFFVAFNLVVPTAYRFFIDEKFHESMRYVPWLTVGYFFTSVYMTYIDYIFYEKKTHILSIITTLNMALNLSLNYVLIQRFGAIGAAYAFAATMFVVMCLAFWFSNRVHPMPWFPWSGRERKALP